MKALTVEKLSKKYGEFTAVDRASFSIAEGEMFGFLGPNGAGKTTTINMLTGLARITSGSAALYGLDYRTELEEIKQLIGVIPDVSNLYAELTGLENLEFVGALYGLGAGERRERAADLLSQFGLAEAGSKPFGAYSRGMKRKLTIAAGIIHRPSVLFLDEPTTGIDVASARAVRKLLVELNKSGTTMFLTTHYIEEAERLCDRIAFIVSGKIVRIGKTAELLREAQDETAVEFTLRGGASLAADSIQTEFPELQVEVRGQNTVWVRSRQTLDLMPFMNLFAQQNLTVYEARLLRPSLEEVFVRVTGIEAQAMKNAAGVEG